MLCSAACSPRRSRGRAPAAGARASAAAPRYYNPVQQLLLLAPVPAPACGAGPPACGMPETQLHRPVLAPVGALSWASGTPCSALGVRQLPLGELAFALGDELHADAQFTGDFGNGNARGAFTERLDTPSPRLLLGVLSGLRFFFLFAFPPRPLAAQEDVPIPRLLLGDFSGFRFVFQDVPIPRLLLGAFSGFRFAYEVPSPRLLLGDLSAWRF